MIKMVKCLSIAFIVTLVLNIGGVSAYSYTTINANTPGYLLTGNEFKSTSVRKINHESQKFDVVSTSGENQVAVYGEDGTRLSAAKWKTFNGAIKLTFSGTNEKLSSDERGGLKVRLYIESTNPILGSHVWGFHFPDPSAYGV